MKKILLITVALFVLSGAATVFAQEGGVVGGPKVLLDFASLDETAIDFTKFPGAMAEGITELTVDMAIGNWGVRLAPSSASSKNRILSFCKPVNSTKMEGEVMGVRIHFPEAPFNSWAQIIPPFQIPFYEDKEGETDGQGSKFINKGVLRNVGTIKSVSVRVTGRNFPHSLSVGLKDEQEKIQELFLGYLDFDGWKTLTWENPNYITDVKQRDLRRTPLYPESTPSIKFEHFTVFRHAEHIGGDFVTYIKDVQMVYDLAILELERDINDEAAWGILGTRRDGKRAAEIRRLGILQLLRKKEAEKMKHAETE